MVVLPATAKPEYPRKRGGKASLAVDAVQKPGAIQKARYARWLVYVGHAERKLLSQIMKATNEGRE